MSTSKNYLLAIGIDNYSDWPQLKNAVNDANSKAQIIANASKMKIKSIKSIAYGNAGIDSNINLADPRQKMVAYANSNYESQAFNFTPNDIIFQDNVTMEFILE